MLSDLTAMSLRPLRTKVDDAQVSVPNYRAWQSGQRRRTVEVDVALCLGEGELDTLADLRVLRGDGEIGKVLEWEGGVGRGALLEEGSGKREDLRALERGVD